MGKITATRDPTSVSIDFSEWQLDVMEQFQNLLDNMLKQGMKLATEKYKCHAWFPIEWKFGDDPCDGVIAGRVPTDPTTIYVELPLGADEDASPRWSFTLTELVEYLIDGGLEGGEGPFLGEAHVSSAIELRDSLRALADRIDSTIRR